jgi:hypothetical protein
VRTCTNAVGRGGLENITNPGYTARVAEPHVEYLAHHWIVLAVPAFLPAVIVVGVVLYVALRDRRAGRSADGGTPDEANQRSDAADETRD